MIKSFFHLNYRNSDILLALHFKQISNIKNRLKCILDLVFVHYEIEASMEAAPISLFAYGVHHKSLNVTLSFSEFCGADMFNWVDVFRDDMLDSCYGSFNRILLNCIVQCVPKN